MPNEQSRNAMDFQEKIDKAGQRLAVRFMKFVRFVKNRHCRVRFRPLRENGERDSGVPLCVNTELFHSRNEC